MNAVTVHRWYTAANTTTVTGTLAADITGVGATSLLHLRGKLKVVGTTTLNTVEYTWPASDGGVGNILTTSGAGILSWTAGGGGGLGGTGTAGTIAKWTAASTLDDSIITESGSVITIAGSINATHATATSITVERTTATALKWGLAVESGAGRLYDYTNSKSFAHFAAGGAATFYYNNAVKLATAAGGITVTGDVAATTGTFSGNVIVNGSDLWISGPGGNPVGAGTIRLSENPSGGGGYFEITQDGSANVLHFYSSNASVNASSLKIRRKRLKPSNRLSS